jgi:hypothetical protein
VRTRSIDADAVVWSHALSAGFVAAAKGFTGAALTSPSGVNAHDCTGCRAAASAGTSPRSGLADDLVGALVGSKAAPRGVP